MLCILLIPLDVLSVTTNAVDVGIVESVFRALFVTVAVLAFVGIPFSYFYVEDSEDDDLTTMKSRSCMDKSWSAAKNTLVFVAVIAILILVALFYKPVAQTAKESPKDVDVWIHSLVNEWRAGALERGLVLVVGCMIVFGLLNLAFYTAYGIATLPVQLMRTDPALEDAQIEEDYTKVERQQKIALLQARIKDPTTNERMKQKCMTELDRLETEERLAAKRMQRLSEMTSDWTYRVWEYLYPIRCLIGLVLGVASFLIVITQTISLLDMWLNSLCGLKCGFVMDTPSFFNPLDKLIVYLSKYFPLDSVALACIAGYLLFATVYGIVRLGIRFALWHVFSIRPKRTWPQALLLLSLFLMLTLLAITVQVVALLPQYSVFGSQTFVDAATNQRVPCRQSHTQTRATEGDAIDLAPCTATQISMQVHRLTVAYPIFSLLFFVGHWLFVLMAVSTFLYKTCTQRGATSDEIRSGLAAYDDVSDDDERASLTGKRSNGKGVEWKRVGASDGL